MITIKIRIPDNLTPSQEAFAISKQLSDKKLLGDDNNLKKIGQGFTIKEASFKIEVERFSKEKVITFHTCVCGNEYQSNFAKKYYTNYGGEIKKHLVCSDDCRETILDFLGKRAAINKSKLNHLTR